MSTIAFKDRPIEDKLPIIFAVAAILIGIFYFFQTYLPAYQARAVVEENKKQAGKRLMELNPDCINVECTLGNLSQRMGWDGFYKRFDYISVLNIGPGVGDELQVGEYEYRGINGYSFRYHLLAIAPTDDYGSETVFILVTPNRGWVQTAVVKFKVYHDKNKPWQNGREIHPVLDGSGSLKATIVGTYSLSTDFEGLASALYIRRAKDMSYYVGLQEEGRKMEVKIQ